MIITCTACEKKFVVPDSAIPSSGRTVQCSSCSNQWKQFPLQAIKNPVKPKPIPVEKKPKKKKASTLIPYSKEYMQQKWGTSVQSYAVQKGLSKKTKTITKTKKPQKQKSIQITEKPRFGFFNYIITFSILFTFLVGVLKFERSRLGRKFPVLEPYIDHFFESLEIFKIFILDFFR